MIWLRKLRIYLGYDEESPVSPDGQNSPETIQFLENAKSALDDAKLRRVEVQKVTSSLANLNKRNHYSESIEKAMMRRVKHA